MSVNVKKPHKTLRRLSARTEKRRIQEFVTPWVLQKPHTCLWSKECGMFGATEGGHVTLVHIGLRGQRLPRIQKTGEDTLWSTT